MNALNFVTTAYRTHAPIKSARNVEYDAFARVVRRLQAAKNHPDLVRALHDNQSLWTILAADVADAGNPLPSQLKAQIFYLAEFTRIHTARVLEQGLSAEVLIDINLSVMRGLE